MHWCGLPPGRGSWYWEAVAREASSGCCWDPRRTRCWHSRHAPPSSRGCTCRSTAIRRARLVEHATPAAGKAGASAPDVEARRAREGLTTGEVQERTAAGRINSVPTATSRTVLAIVQANVFTLFNAVVGGCFILLFVLGQWRDALFGLSAISNSLIGIVQEYRAKRSLDQLAILQVARNTVVRNGARETISSEDLVPDDLVVLTAGDQVTADLLLLGESPLEVDESLLT